MTEQVVFDENEPIYTIGMVARMVSLHPQTLRHYEEIGLVVPYRSSGNVRLYAPVHIERIRKIVRLTRELGVNLAAVEIIMRMSERIEALTDEIERLRALLGEDHPFDR